MTQWALLAPTEYRRRSSGLQGLQAHAHGHDLEHTLVPLENEPSAERSEILRTLRPQKLIGESVPLCDWEKAFVPPEKLAKIKNKGVRQYYAHQNELLARFTNIDELLDSGISLSLIEEYGDDIGTENPRRRASHPEAVMQASNDGPVASLSGTVKFWININLAANVLLLVGKLVVFFLTDSLSIVASLVDSVLDMLSTLIIFVSARFADRRDWKTRHLYPVGRNRLEPIGVLVFSVIMIVSFLKIADESLTALWPDPNNASKVPVSIGTPALVIMTLTIAVKLVLWILCRHVPSSSVQALAQDAETDVTFNFFSIVFPVLGHLANIWQFDPSGALVLSLYVIWSWGSTAMQHIDNLTGAAASPEDRQQLLYLCTRFSQRVEYITGLNAYYAGDRIICEVDVCLDKSLSMRDSHDLAEALQYAIESLPIIERAFVHLDYRRGNFTGHML